VSELWTEDHRLASLYDTECIGRRDHAFYVTLAETLAARSIVDIGCGTGVFAIELARRGCHVIGAEPAQAMLDLSRARPGGEDVHWVHGDARDVPSGVADLVVMMGHVAQYFIDDSDWARLLAEVHRILAPGGSLTFETRNPAIDWARLWTREQTAATHAHPDGGTFTAWVEMRERRGTDASYTTVHEGHTVLPDGTHLCCAETLRFRSVDEIFTSLADIGFDVDRTWGDWDHSALTPTSRELIVLARRRCYKHSRPQT
jgi:SAM-dependent methyltransferase